MDITINYGAVVLAAAVNMIVGSLWYGPVFGKMWMGLMGFTPESMKNMKMTMQKAMALGFVTAFVMAYVLARFSFISGATDVMDALQLAFFVWLGFFATVSMGSYLWEGKPFKLFVLNAAEQLVALVGMAMVLVLWK